MTTGKQVVNALHERGFIKRNALREAEEFLDELFGDGELGVIAGAPDDRAVIADTEPTEGEVFTTSSTEVTAPVDEPQPVDEDGVDIPTPDAADDVVDPTAKPDTIDAEYPDAEGAAVLAENTAAADSEVLTSE